MVGVVEGHFCDTCCGRPISGDVGDNCGGDGNFHRCKKTLTPRIKKTLKNAFL